MIINNDSVIENDNTSELQCCRYPSKTTALLLSFLQQDQGDLGAPRPLWCRGRLGEAFNAQ